MTKKKRDIQSDDGDFTWKHAFAVIILIAFLWAASYIIIWTYFGDLDTASKFGNLFSPIAALFSGLALSGVVAAIFLQRRELSLQRKELELTRKELSRSAKAQEASESALTAQASALERTVRLDALTFLPVLKIDLLMGKPGDTYVRVSNLSRLFAFDVNVILIGRYEDEVIPLETFKNRFIVEGSKLLNQLLKDAKVRVANLKPDEENAYSAFDQMTFRFLPSEKQMTAKLVFPWIPAFVYVLLQHRDLQGTNYHQLIYFDRSFGDAESSEDDRFFICGVNPKVATPSQRISYVGSLGNGSFSIAMEDKSAIPEYLTYDFSRLLENAIPPGLLDEDGVHFEERGVMADL